MPDPDPVPEQRTESLIVEFIVPHYFCSLLEWENGLGAAVHFREDSVGPVYGSLHRVENREDLLDVCELDGTLIVRCFVESIQRIVVT